MKLSDCVMSFVKGLGVSEVFGLTGGAVVHLFDSADKVEGIRPIFCHHEQAAALAAVAYAKVHNGFGCAVVTTGPGGTNAITGVTAAWQDSIPAIFISGQSRLNQTSRGKPVRQIGSQELDIVSIVEPITKYAVMVTDAQDIRAILEEAAYRATEGRPGPVWVDVPVNLQWADVDWPNLRRFAAPEKPRLSADVESQVAQSIAMLLSAKRPVLVVGYGTRLSGGCASFLEMASQLNIPYVCTWGMADLAATDAPLNLGRLGVNGQRGANLAVQNADLVLGIGTHFHLTTTGTKINEFAYDAKIVVVDIDANELRDHHLKPELSVCMDAKLYMAEARKYYLGEKPDCTDWLQLCQRYKAYNQIPESLKHDSPLDANFVVDEICRKLNAQDFISVDGGGTTLYAGMQSSSLKNGQRLIVSGGISSMGTGLPEAIGISFANDRKRTICFIGDGSFQLNVQELQTMVHYNLPIKIFVFNNDGYLAIRHTQKSFLAGNYCGSSVDGGVSIPDIVAVGEAYKVKSWRLAKKNEISSIVDEVLNHAGPALCEVMVRPDQDLIAQLGFDKNPDGTMNARPLEDMYPYLPREELKSLMAAKKRSRL